jgi:hypothetical protein
MWKLGIRLWALWRFVQFTAAAVVLLAIIYAVDGPSLVFVFTGLVATLALVAVYYALRDFVRREVGHPERARRLG